MEAVQLTLAEAASVLEPPLSEQQLRAIVSALGWQPAGIRRNGHPGRSGRQKHTYDWAQLAQLHAAIIPFLHAPCVSPAGSP